MKVMVEKKNGQNKKSKFSSQTRLIAIQNWLMQVKGRMKKHNPSHGQNTQLMHW
jgi:hypothetical protein